MNSKSTMGSVISPRHLQRIQRMVEQRSSGTILIGGEPLKDRSSLDGFDFSRGSFYPPTVIADVSLDDTLWKEEVFGPVVVLDKFEARVEFAKYSGLYLYADVTAFVRRRSVRAWNVPTTRNMGWARAYGRRIYHELIRSQHSYSPAWCG
jgi:Aldehyde dehydrogenase family